MDKKLGYPLLDIERYKNTLISYIWDIIKVKNRYESKFPPITTSFLIQPIMRQEAYNMSQLKKQNWF